MAAVPNPTLQGGRGGHTVNSAENRAAHEQRYYKSLHAVYLLVGPSAVCWRQTRSAVRYGHHLLRVVPRTASKHEQAGPFAVRSDTCSIIGDGKGLW